MNCCFFNFIGFIGRVRTRPTHFYLSFNMVLDHFLEFCFLSFSNTHNHVLSVMSVNLNTTLYPDSPCVKVFYNKSYEPNRRTLSATIIGFMVIPL